MRSQLVSLFKEVNLQSLLFTTKDVAMTVNRLDNFLEKKKERKKRVSFQVKKKPKQNKNMQLYSLEGHRTMCGMRPNTDKLVAFYRGLDFLIGV